jgi:tripartite-type tricarboxylate transporter receptor subunit TctC
MRCPFLVRAFATAAWMACVGTPALAQAPYPSRLVKIVVPFAPGGGVDTVARLLAEEMKTSLGQPVIVENTPGASGMRGAEVAARSEPDGYTLLLSSAGEIAVNQHLFKDMRYDPRRDLAPVSLVVRVPNVLVVGASSPFGTLDELIKAAQTTDKITYSSSGIGNPQHLAGELFNKMTSSKMVHVPYRGAAQQVTDVLGNNVTATFASYLAVAPFVQSGQVRALGVTSAERIPSLPSVPAIAENAQLKGFDVTNWFGLFAPSKTPPAIIETLNKAVSQALANPAIARKLEELGSYPAANASEAFRAFVAAETVKFKDIVIAADIKLP